MKYKTAIKSSLNNIVGEELGSKIFQANFPKPITGYKRGKVLSFKEIKELPENTIIYIYYVDDDKHVREDGFQKLYKNSNDEFSAGAFPFPMNEHINDSELIEGRDNCGWSFTIREAIKIGRTEFSKIQKEKKDAKKAIALIEKLMRGESLTKIQKKELKKHFK